MKQTIKRLFALTVMLLMVWPAYACTTAVISGKFTKTGRPMIWKVRDTEAYRNTMMRFTNQAKWDYVGLVNSDDKNGEQIWGGFNDVGFSIMNSASFNVNADYKGDVKDREGIVMHQALKTCKTLKDFENMLDSLPRPMGVAAHFGVIDAEGGAAFYEVNNETWTKFDANDPVAAPRGYVLRTNFSETGTKGEGLGFVRCQTAGILFSDIKPGSLDVKEIMQNFSRSMFNSVTKDDYRLMYQDKPISDKKVIVDDLISRYGTSSTILIEGVNKAAGERANQTTGWIQLGLPYVSLTIPVWCGVDLPSVLARTADGKNAPLSEWAMSLKEYVFPLWKQSDGYHYIEIAKLLNDTKEGITQQIEKDEQGIFDRTASARMIWRKDAKLVAKGNDSKEALVAAFNKQAESLYQKLMKGVPPSTSEK